MSTPRSALTRLARISRPSAFRCWPGGGAWRQRRPSRAKRDRWSVCPKARPGIKGLSSSFGGDSRASTAANRLLSTGFSDHFRVPELARISPRGEHDAIPASRPASMHRRATPARTHPATPQRTARRAGRPGCASREHAPVGDQDASPRRAHRACRRMGSAQSAQRNAENPKNGVNEGRSNGDRSLQRLGASRPPRTATAYYALRASPVIDHPDITARHPCRLIFPPGTPI